MKKIGLLLLLSLLSAAPGFAESRFADSRWRLHLELDQMLCLKVGAEYSLSPRWGIKASLGPSFFGLGQISYDLVGICHFRGTRQGLKRLRPAAAGRRGPSPESSGQWAVRVESP